MTFQEELAAVAVAEWTRWGGPVERIDGTLVGFKAPKMEEGHPYWTYVGEYWKAVGSDRDGRSGIAWSAAFISHCFKKAGAQQRFPYHENHSIYVARIVSGNYAGLSLEDPGVGAPAIGDLIWAGRPGPDCRTPPSTYADAKSEAKKIQKGTAASFCSHSDIVVAVRPGEIDVIGGNVKDATTRTTYRLDVHGRIADARRPFIGVIRNAL